MNQYNYNPDVLTKNGERIKFNFSINKNSHMSNKNGWKTFRLTAEINGKNIGYIDFSNIDDNNFFKNYTILGYLDLYKGLDLYIDKEKRINAALDNGLTEKEESFFNLSKKEIVNVLARHTGKFNYKKIDFFESIGMIDEIFNELLDEIEIKYGDEFLDFKNTTVNHSIIEHVNVIDEYKRQGIGKELYSTAAYICSLNKTTLTASYNQSSDAEAIWKYLSESTSIPVKFDHYNNFTYIDYKPEIEKKSSKEILFFKNKIMDLTDDMKLANEITKIWSRKNENFGSIFKEKYLIKSNNKIDFIFDNNILTIDKNKSSKILSITNQLPKVDREKFKIIEHYFDKKNKPIIA
jgi:GNAT superfamily N-acetyltransferase